MNTEIFITKEEFEALSANRVLNKQAESYYVHEWFDSESYSVYKRTWFEDDEKFYSYWIEQNS